MPSGWGNGSADDFVKEDEDEKDSPVLSVLAFLYFVPFLIALGVGLYWLIFS